MEMDVLGALGLNLGFLQTDFVTKFRVFKLSFELRDHFEAPVGVFSRFGLFWRFNFAPISTGVFLPPRRCFCHVRAFRYVFRLEDGC